jgi:deoxyribodipyrimidine photolyase-related protein
MKSAHLIFPHQLFASPDIPEVCQRVYLIEEFLFFRQYNFHKQKIAFHRASMKFYEDYLQTLGYEVHYIDSNDTVSDLRKLLPELKTQGFEHLSYVDPSDNWLSRRIQEGCAALGMRTECIVSVMFINTPKELSTFFGKDKKKYHHASFYIEQRKLRKILIDDEDTPLGGKWSFDAENRKKYPAGKQPPFVQYPDLDERFSEAKRYVEAHFASNLGEMSEYPMYPVTHEGAQHWLSQFLEQRFAEFGTFEDAIVAENSILNHSVLTPMLNTGLLSPGQVIQSALRYSRDNDIPMNSTEGFVRQVMGWREFIRGVYEARGSFERSRNFWGFNRKIPPSFYDGTTGVEPVDKTIRKVLATGYCHHIERLMILGNFMLLCEFDPDEVYRWFMELFIDSYDWVMVPNVYGMSQFADGGLMATKPYISGSNYVLKMSNYKKGEWQQVWDGLFWRFMDRQRDFFSQNPRLGMLVRMFDKMPEEKRQDHRKNGQIFLDSLDQGGGQTVG